MSLAAGTRLGPYEILCALGAGGMGEVYRARDTRLNRDVAFDLGRLETRGTPATVLPRVATTITGAADVSVSDTGTLVYVDAPGGIGGASRTLVWVDRTGREQPIAAPPRAYMHPRIFPDGTRVALWTDDQENDIWMWSGRSEVYVRPFPNAAGGQWQVSTAGGSQPLWAPSGGELFYFALDGTLMAVPGEVRNEAWSAGAPAKILDARYFTGGLGAITFGRTYDVSPDGRRFLMIKQEGAGNQTSTPPQIVVVQNWFEELKRLVPAN